MTAAVTAGPRTEIMYLLWSNKHKAWWAPNDCGYTDDELQAGRYTERDAAERVIRSAQAGLLHQVTCMVAAPENWPTT